MKKWGVLVALNWTVKWGGGEWVKEKAKALQCEHYCFWALHTLLLMRKRCQSCGGLHEQPQTRARTQPNTGFQCARSAFISCHLSTWNPGPIFNIQSWICLLGHACTEQTTVKYHTSLLVFCHGGETSPPTHPQRVNPSDLPHVVIELFPISCLFFWLVCPTLNQKCCENHLSFFAVFAACFHREAPGQWQSILCQPQHTDNTVGRSSDPRVRPRLKCILTSMSVHEFDCCFGCYIGRLLWEHCHLGQKATALIRTLTSLSATFKPLIPKLCTFRHQVKNILGLV